jgi:hypothetical protein
MLTITWKTDDDNKLYAQWETAEDKPVKLPKVRTRNTRKMNKEVH